MAVMLIPCGAGDIMQSALWKITEWILLFMKRERSAPGTSGGKVDSGKTTALADCLLLWGSSILFVEKKEGKERGQTNRETGGKTACDSWDPAHPARNSKVETRADGADYAGCGTG